MQAFSVTTAPSTRTPVGSPSEGGTVRFGRNYLLGLWAAGELRMSGRDARRYAAQIAHLGETAVNDEALVNTVRADIAAYGGDIGEPVVWRQLHRCAETAAREYAGAQLGDSPPLAA